MLVQKEKTSCSSAKLLTKKKGFKTYIHLISYRTKFGDNYDHEELVEIETPYGAKLKRKLLQTIEFCVHLKDKTKIRHKKRWSQVKTRFV